MDFSQTRFSLSRNPLSYAKVEKLVAWAIRGWSIFYSRKRADILNIGCGPNTHDDHYCVDYGWSLGIDACCDIRRGLPVASDSFSGVFSEHCLEHIDLGAFRYVLSELMRVMKSGARLRIVVPDAELYIRGYIAELDGEVDYSDLPYRTLDVEPTALASVNRIFRDHGHQFAWDFRTMKFYLEAAGFTDVSRKAFGDGDDPRLLVDSHSRAAESLYLEAVRP